MYIRCQSAHKTIKIKLVYQKNVRRRILRLSPECPQILETPLSSLINVWFNVDKAIRSTIY